MSYRSANLLLGNDECAAAIECALLGPELLFTSDAFIAVTGAWMTPMCDGEEVPRNTVVAIQATGQAGVIYCEIRYIVIG